jgi:hypothetical protein
MTYETILKLAQVFEVYGDQLLFYGSDYSSPYNQVESLTDPTKYFIDEEPSGSLLSSSFPLEDGAAYEETEPSVSIPPETSSVPAGANPGYYTTEEYS